MNKNQKMFWRTDFSPLSPGKNNTNLPLSILFLTWCADFWCFKDLVFLHRCLGNQKQHREFSCLDSPRIRHFPYRCFRMKACQGRKTIFAIIYHIDDNSKWTHSTQVHTAHSGDKRKLTQKECAGLTV